MLTIIDVDIYTEA